MSFQETIQSPLHKCLFCATFNTRASWMYMTLSSCMKYFKEGVIVDSSSIIIRSQVANDKTNLCWCDLGEDPYIGCHGIFTSMTLLEIIGESLGIQCLANFKKHHLILASQVADNDLSLFDSNSLNSIRASIISWVSIVPFPSRSKNVKSDLAASSLSSRITFHRKSHW